MFNEAEAHRPCSLFLLRPKKTWTTPVRIIDLYFFPSFSSSFPFHLTLLLSLTADILLSLAVAHC